jgi:hypothetical protein
MNPNRDAPIEIRKLIDRIAGLNPYGKPQWRVCLAQHVMKKCGGVFHNLENVRSMLTQGPSRMMFLPNGQRVMVPGKKYYKKVGDRVTTGFMEVPKYPQKGWIIERWFPPHLFGTERDWAAQKSEDGSRMMGPFPKQGDYFMLSGPFEKMPGWGDIENSIRHWECEQRLRPADLAGAIQQQMRDEEADRQRRLQAFEDELEQMRKSELLPMLKSTSLAAQRYRQELNRLIGDPSHFAAL